MNTFFEILGIGLSTISAGFLSWGILSLSPKRIIGAIINKGGHTRYAKELVSSSVDNKIGCIFLFLSIVLQVRRIMTPLTWGDLIVSYCGGIIGFLTLLILFLVAIKVRYKLIKRIGRIVKMELSNNCVAWNEDEYQTSSK